MKTIASGILELVDTIRDMMTTDDTPEPSARPAPPSAEADAPDVPDSPTKG